MVKGRIVLRVSALAILAALAGCAALPRSGPGDRAVESAATVKVGSGDHKTNIDYALIDISKDILQYIADSKPATLKSGFGGGRGGAPELPLGVGDVVSVTVFEAQAGGLFIPAEAGSRAGNFVTLPNQTIDRSGTLTVPYAGQIPAAGRPATVVQADIQDRLANRAIEPQVIITTVTSRSSQVSVLGDVNTPSKIEISPAGERILDVIAEAGGLSSPGIETYVTLQRGGREATVLYDDIVKTPAENIYVLPGDTISVNRERRTYLAFGATGASGRFDFEESKLVLGEALGKAGGLLDSQADPSQVLLYRIEDRKLLEKMGVDLSKFKGDEVPVIYRANLRDPGAFFAVQKFPMHDKDIVYVSNAASYELTKLLSIINSISTTTSGVPSDALSARDAVRGF